MKFVSQQAYLYYLELKLWPGKSSSTISGCGCLLWFRRRSWVEEKIQMWRDIVVAILLEITTVLPSHKVCPFQLGQHPSQRFPQTSVLLCKISATQWLNCLLSTEVIWGIYQLNTTLLYLFSCFQADRNQKKWNSSNKKGAKQNQEKQTVHRWGLWVMFCVFLNRNWTRNSSKQWFLLEDIQISRSYAV